MPETCKFDYLYDFDFTKLVDDLEKLPNFSDSDNWSIIFKKICSSLSLMGNDVKKATDCLSIRRKSAGFGDDTPTDIYTVLTITMFIRNVGILYSKSKSISREKNNKELHKQLLDEYFDALKKIFNDRESILRRFPPST